MSSVALIRFVCLAVFLLCSLNFCLLNLFIYFVPPYKMWVKITKYFAYARTVHTHTRCALLAMREIVITSDTGLAALRWWNASCFTSAALQRAAQCMCECHHWNTLTYYLSRRNAQRIVNGFLLTYLLATFLSHPANRRTIQNCERFYHLLLGHYYKILLVLNSNLFMW